MGKNFLKSTPPSRILVASFLSIIVVGTVLLVITSYSIHYTKLYEKNKGGK